MSKDRAEEYRKRADECRKIAANSQVPADRERWLMIAEEWMRMAIFQEGKPD